MRESQLLRQDLKMASAQQVMLPQQLLQRSQRNRKDLRVGNVNLFRQDPGGKAVLMLQVASLLETAGFRMVITTFRRSIVARKNSKRRLLNPL